MSRRGIVFLIIGLVVLLAFASAAYKSKIFFSPSGSSMDEKKIIYRCGMCGAEECDYKDLRAECGTNELDTGGFGQCAESNERVLCDEAPYITKDSIHIFVKCGCYT